MQVDLKKLIERPSYDDRAMNVLHTSDRSTAKKYMRGLSFPDQVKFAIDSMLDYATKNARDDGVLKGSREFWKLL